MFAAKTTYNSSEKTWSGLSKEKRFPLDWSVGDALYKVLKSNPTHICQISDADGVSLTNEEMLKFSIRIAQNLNLEEDDMVGVMAANSTYLAAVLFASWIHGTIAHPISTVFHQDTVRHVFGITRPKVIFCDADNYETLAGACKQLNLSPRIYTINGQIEGVPNVNELLQPTGSEQSFYPRNSKKDGDATAMILCSSGTTGLPKGVCLSHSYLLEILKPIPSGAVNFSFSNMDWLSGLGFLINSTLSSATRICTTDTYTPQKLRELIEKYKVNLVSVSASYLTTFVKSGEAEKCDLSSIRIFIVTGASTSHNLYVQMQEYLVPNGFVTNAYVGTEFGGVAMNMKISKPKSVGQVLDGVKVRIVNDDGVNLGIGEPGEILVWSGQKWGGYYGNPLETNNMLDDHGWYHTGDIGVFDEDGDLHLVDRKKEVMKYRSVHYSAQQIEQCISSLSDVSEVCVFGTKDDEEGDLATAAIVKKPGSTLTEKEVVDHVQREMSDEKWLRGGVYFVQDIPKTGSGKYIRIKTRDMCLKMQNH